MWQCLHCGQVKFEDSLFTHLPQGFGKPRITSGRGVVGTRARDVSREVSAAVFSTKAAPQCDFLAVAGGEWAGWQCDFEAATGALRSVDTRYLSETAVEWGQIPSGFELLTTERVTLDGAASSGRVSSLRKRET